MARPRNDDRVVVIGGTQVEMAAVYVIGDKRGCPVKIGYSRKPTRFLKGAQLLHYAAWTVDLMLARRVQLAAERLLDKAKKRRPDQWFDVPVEWAIKVIRFSGRQQGVTLYTDKALDRMSMTREDLKMQELSRVSGISFG